MEEITPEMLQLLRETREKQLFAQYVFDEVSRMISAQYKLQSGDSINIETGVIVRVNPNADANHPALEAVA